MDQAVASLSFEPLLPRAALAALAILCAAVIALSLWRRARGALPRALAFAVVLAFLAGPRLVRETREGLKDIGLLVVDDTGSMHIGKRVALRDAARAAIEREAARLPGFELRTITVPEGGDDGTHLFGAIDQALADIPRSRLAGIALLSDGQVHDIPAIPPDAPTHLLLPASGEETDRRLRVIEAPSYGIVGHSVTLRIAVDDLGVAHPAGSAKVTIRHDGDPPEEIEVPIGQERPVEIPIQRAGPSVVELAAEPLPGAVSTINDRAVVQINGVRDRLRVLLVSGEPNEGERTWRRLLKADPSVDLVHFTILRPPEKDDMTPLNELALIAFPVRELFQEKIAQFDLIILDRFQNRNILPQTYLRNIADYVRHGGALLLSVGPEFASPASLGDTPLGAVLPAQAPHYGGIIEEAFRPSVTALGERHPVTDDLPGWHDGAAPDWGSWYRSIEPESVQGQVLMSGPEGKPLLVLSHVDQGRAALLLSDQIWLWSRGHQGGGPQAELLRRVAHWLMKEPELEEEALTARIDGGQLHVERRSLSDAPPDQVRVTAPDGTVTRLALTQGSPGANSGRGTASMPAALPGVWQANDGTRNAYAAAGLANPLEYADLRATADKLAPLVRATGGGVHWLDPAGAPELRRVARGQAASGSDWIGFRRNDEHLVTGVSATPLLPAWAALPLLLGLVVAAWKREGS